MKHLFLLYMISFSVFAQNSAKIIRNSGDLQTSQVLSNFKKVKYNHFTLQLVGVKSDSSKEKVSIDSAWGYTPREKRDYKAVRIYNRTKYKLLESDNKVFVYFVKPKMYSSRLFVTPFLAFYRFSTSFEGEIYKLNKRNLLKYGGEDLLKHIQSNPELNKFLKRKVRFEP